MEVSGKYAVISMCEVSPHELDTDHVPKSYGIGLYVGNNVTTHSDGLWARCFTYPLRLCLEYPGIVLVA